MAGSRKWFVYSSDIGTDYAIQLDESNTEEVMGGAGGDYTDTTTINAAVPRNITPRAVYYGNAARTRVIKCTVLTAARYASILDGTNVQSITDPIDTANTLTLIRAQGEQITIPFPFDSGLTDGDDT